MAATAASCSVQELYRLLTVYDLPNYVKEASTKEIIADELVPTLSFGDAVRRQYPCHTPAATLLSAANFLDKSGGNTQSHTYARIKQAAEYFGILADCEQLEEKIAAAYQRKPDDDDDYVFVWTDADGHKQRNCPLRNAVEVKKAADWFRQYRHELPLKDRQHFAERLLEKAAKYGANIREHMDLVHRTLGRGVCSAKTAAALLSTRLHPRMPTKIRQELEKLTKKLASSHYGDTIQQHHLQRLAEVVDEIDWNWGFHRKYGQDVAMPEDILFEITEEKLAEATDDIVGSPLTGNFYKLSDLKRLTPADLNDIETGLGDEVAVGGAFVSTHKLAEIIPTLPRSTAEVLDMVLAERGVYPIATKAGAATGLADEDLRMLADVHQQTAPPPGSLWAALSAPSTATS